MTEQINETFDSEKCKLKPVSTQLEPVQQGRALAVIIGVNKKVKQMKRWIPAMLLPLVLLQAPALA
jgi:hypothetical protein